MQLIQKKGFSQNRFQNRMAAKVHAASVGVKIWKQCLPCSENFCFRPLELDSINKINKNIFSFPIRHSILFNLWILKSHHVFSKKKNTNCVLYFQGSANFWEKIFWDFVWVSSATVIKRQKYLNHVWGPEHRSENPKSDI